MTDMTNFLCNDCGIDTIKIHEYYMVKNRIWKKSKIARHRMLCISCLEKRIGRELIPDDFTDAPLNLIDFPLWPRSHRLMQRLGHE